jgi:4-amino-4-deoxy-L-arabinose transferase-like glycosyltransferase
MGIPDDHERPWSTKTVLWGIGFLLLFTLTLRLHHLDHESLFMDEIRQVSYYPHNFEKIIVKAASQQQPPLDYWIGHIVGLISSSDFAVRMPAVVFGSGAVILFVLLLLQVTNPPTAFFTGLVAALLPFNIYYSQQARPYAIAIFFTLLTIFVLDRAIKKTSFPPLDILLLFLCATGYLYSRAYTPLLVIVAIIAVLIIRFLYLWRVESWLKTPEQKRIIFAILALGAAIIVCFPMMKQIIKMGYLYVPRASQPIVEILNTGFSRFSLRPLWEAYLTQADPIGFPLLPLVIVSPVFLLLPRWRKNFLLFSVSLLLPVVSILDCFIFPAVSNSPFRPPYPIYLLPLCLFLGAAIYNELWRRTSIPATSGRLMRWILVLMAIAGMLLITRSTLAFKETTRHEDWRALAQYLSKNAGPDQILIFDAITPYGNWEPVFYGFPRYYHGQSATISLSRIYSIVGLMLKMKLEPLAVLFIYRNVLLTPDSPYPVMPSFADFEIDIAPIRKDPELMTHVFTSFLTVRLKSPTGNSAADTLKLFQRILSHLKENSSTVDIHLAIALLAKAIGETQLIEEHLNLAVKLTPPQQRAAVVQIAEAIRPTETTIGF